MKRSTWLTLAAFVLLLGLWFAKSRPHKVDAPPPLSVDGYIGNVGIEEARTLGQKQPAPYTHIALTRTDGKGGKQLIELDKQDTAKLPEAKPDAKTPPPEAVWLAKRTVDGKTTTWKAQGFRATSMAEQLQRSIRSNFAVKIEAKTAAEYGLDPDHAIDVELTGGGKPAVKLRIGLLQKAEKDGDATTWVADPARPDVAYQLTGRDLRTAFDISWNDLRDRQLLTLDVPAVDRLELERPGQTPQRIVVTRPPLGSDKNAERPWTIAEPAGVRAGDIDDWLKALERLSAAEFVATSEEAVRSSGLDTPDAAKLTIANDRETIVVVFGKSDESRPNKETWVRVVGRDEVYRVGSYQRDQVLLSLAQIQDRHLWAGRTAKDLQSFTISGPNGHFKADHGAHGWQATAAEEPADPSKIAAYLETVAALKVDLNAQLPDEAAMDNPQWSIRWTFLDGIQRVILSKEVAGNVYGKLSTADGATSLFKLTAWNAKQLAKQPSDFAAHSSPSGAADSDHAPALAPPVRAP